MIATWTLTRAAVAQPARPSAIVIVETRDAPPLPTLGSQVELHAAQPVRIEMRTQRDADPFTFVEQANEMVASGDAELVVWIAPVDDGYLVFAAGPWPDRAVIELARVDTSIAPAELERTIALKVAGLLDTLRAQLASAPAGPTPAAATAGATVEASALPARERRWRVEVTAMVARESYDRAYDGRTSVAVGRAWRSGTWELAPSIGGYWQPSGTIEGEDGRAAITELGGVVAVEASRTLGPVDALARPRVTLAVLRARGQSDDGRRGGATVLAPYVGAELGVRRSLTPAAWAGLVVGAEVAAIHQEFLIDDETIADLGRIRLHVGMSLTIGL